MSASEIDSKRPMASASLHAFDPGLGDIGGDHGVVFRPAEAEQAEAWHQHDAGQGIELVLDAADALIVTLEILVDSACKLDTAGSRVALAKSSSLPASGAGRTSGQFLVRMVWSGVITPPWLNLRQILVAEEIQHCVAGAEFENEPPPCAFGRVVFLAARAAYDRRDLRRPAAYARCRAPRRFCGSAR